LGTADFGGLKQLGGARLGFGLKIGESIGN